MPSRCQSYTTLPRPEHGVPDLVSDGPPLLPPFGVKGHLPQHSNNIAAPSQVVPFSQIYFSFFSHQLYFPPLSYLSDAIPLPFRSQCRAFFGAEELPSNSFASGVFRCQLKCSVQFLANQFRRWGGGGGTREGKSSPGDGLLEYDKSEQLAYGELSD